MRSPVFIIAPERSGSTLLRLVLSAHPQLCFPPEGSVALALRNFANQRDLAGQETELAQVLFAREPKMKDWGLTAAEVAARWRNKRPLTPQALVDEVYLAYRDRAAPEALFYGDKNPIHVFHLPLIRQLHPSVRFIYLLRDPRATYASAKRRAGSWKGFSRSLTAAAVMWRQAAIHTSRASNADNGFAMRYEEFVTDPEDQLRRLCDWIGVP